MKVKIVFCNHYARPGWLDGAEVSLLQIISALPANQFEKVLVTPAMGEMPQLAQKLGVTVHVAPLSLVWSMGGIAKYNKGRYSGIQQHLKYLLSAENAEIFRFKRFLTSIRPQLLFINTGVNVLPAIVGKRLGIQTVWFPREFFRGDFVETYQVLNQFSDQIWVASAAMENLLRSSAQLSVKLLRVPNFIDLANLEENQWANQRQILRNRYGLSPSQTAICYWSSISPLKGISDFIQMAHHLREQHGQKVKFFVAGSASHDAYLQQAIAQSKALGLQNELLFVGFFPHPQHFLPGMDIVIHPSQFTETFSRTALDAMAFRKPIVSYNSGAITELVRQDVTGFLVSKGDIMGLCKFCSTLIVDPELRQLMGNSGRQMVENHYSTAQVLPLMLNALSNLLHHGR
jgi:glycosyltransferase involved in cell wall biosynthesis